MADKPSFHEDLKRDETANAGSERGFGIVFAAVFAIIGLLPLTGGRDPRWWSLAVGLGFLVLAFVRPRWLGPLNRLWFRFGLLLHKVVSPVVMALLFYGTVTPVGLLMRLFGKDPLRLRLDPAAKTYWIERHPPGPDSQTMRNQF